VTRAGLGLCVVATCALSALGADVGRARADVRVEMTADRTQVRMNEQIAVRITVQTQGSSQPEIEVPEFEGFQIVQRSVQRPMQFSFGFGQNAPVVTSSTQYAFVLAPMGPGTFKIPPVRVTYGKQTYQSAALELTVAGAPGQAIPPGQPAAPAQQPGAAAATNPQNPQAAQPADAVPTAQATGDAAIYDGDAFLRTVVDKTEPYEGEQVTATIYLYTRRNLQQAPAVQSEASTGGLWTHDLLSATRSLDPTRQVVNGRGFWVYVLRRFAAFPLRAGELTLGSMALTISRDSVFDLFDPGRAEPDIKRNSVPILLKVKPLPAQGKPTGEVAVGQFQLESQLDRKQVVTGDAVTLKATVKGQGNIRSVRLADPVIDGMQVLQPETHDVVESPGDRVQGTRSFAWLLVPRAPGTYTIPPLEFSSFDPTSGRYQKVRSAPLTLTAAGNARPDLALNTGPAETEADEPAAPERAWPPIRPLSELTRPTQTLASRALYPWALALFPFVWLGTLVVPALRRMRAHDPLSAQREAQNAAHKKLVAAREAAGANDGRRFHAELSAALLGLLAARLNEPVTGLTQTELRALLTARGVPDAQCKQLLAVLSQCDFARFSASAVAADDLQRTLAQAELLWSELSAFSPQPVEPA
jgi:BatD DUF11 like domain